MSRVAIAQMTSSSDVEYNLTKIQTLFQQVAEQEAQLLVLPENAFFMGKHELDKIHIAETFGVGLIQDTVRNFACQHGLWVIAGTIPITSSAKRIRSSCMVYDNYGDLKARYDKIHLFDVQVSDKESYCESETTEPGDEVVVVDTPIGRVGLSICYDLRFPELYRELMIKGAEILAVPAAFTQKTGQAHWELLLKARAIENLCYVVASNQAGMHDNQRETFGHSMVIEPWGSTVSELKLGEGVFTANIDMNELHNIRHRFPCNEHHVLI